MNLVLVGEHPDGYTGNSRMMAALLEKIKLNPTDHLTVFACSSSGLVPDAFAKREYNLIEAGLNSEDYFGLGQLINTIYQSKVDIVMFVGVDLWRFINIYKDLEEIKKQKKFVWIALFPYDLHEVRPEWISWMKNIDFPLVYSQYGYDMLHPHNERVRYFRPPLYEADLFKPLSTEIRREKRISVFQNLNTNKFLFGFFGSNLIRKDPQRIIYSFFEARKRVMDLSLYLHTEASGVYNLHTYLNDKDSQPGDVYIKKQGTCCVTPALVELYNVVDCMVNASMQEGLSWTLLEAMLSGTPIIAADSTAQSELKEGFLPITTNKLSFVPVTLPSGISYVESKACDKKELEEAMVSMATDIYLRESYIEKGFKVAKEWLEGVSDINEIFREAFYNKNTASAVKKKQRKILFVQHSSAGDVLMTTQCLKPIKEKHKLPLVYMTQPQYQDIVEGNPYINEIIDYDESVINDYQIVYNPHGEKILPGGWNNLDVTLHSLYPYFCKIKPDNIFIQEVNPDITLPEKYIVLHNTGGSKYRIYPHMKFIVQKSPYPCIQVGGALDLVIPGAIDLRGRLSFRETAYVMKRAEAAVVIDSYPAHLAGALGTPVIVLFGPAPARVTQPRGDTSKMIFLEPKMLDVCPITSHCWGAPPSGKKECLSPCINTINFLHIVESLKKLLKGKDDG